MPSTGQPSPRERAEAECARRGRDAFVADCVALLRSRTEDPTLIRSLAPGADKFFDGREHDDTYWFRVWGARSLLWVWDDVATAAIVEAAGDEHWRVREMAAKVVARHLVGDAFEAMTALRDDGTPRVRAAAERALQLLVAAAV